LNGTESNRIKSLTLHFTNVGADGADFKKATAKSSKTTAHKKKRAPKKKTNSAITAPKKKRAYKKNAAPPKKMNSAITAQGTMVEPTFGDEFKKAVTKSSKITAPLNHHVTSIITEDAAENKRSVPKIEDDFVTKKVKKQQVRNQTYSNSINLFQQLTKLFQFID